MVIDDIDRRLMLCLLREGRIQTKVLAERIGLSAPAVAERVRRLEDAGVIKGYTARLDLAKLGFGVQAFVRVAAVASQGPVLLKAFESCPEVQEVNKVTGDDSYLLRLIVKSVQDLESVIERLSVGVRLSTSIVLTTESDADAALERLLDRLPVKQSRPAQ